MSPLSSCPGADCASRVLDAAFEVFCETGYRTSIDTVAQRAQVARQTIYNHFGSKEALFSAAMGKAVKELFAMLAAEEGDWHSRLYNFGQRFRERVLAPEAINLHRLLTSEAQRFPELAGRMYENCFLYSRRQIGDVLEQAMNEGQLRREDPLEAAHILLDMLVSADHMALVLGGPMLDPRDEPAKVKRALELFSRVYAVPIES
ncbi:TetR/AcrR family transcriptional regulator [Chitinolyticbacter meiyuanensis]|uniref:TetR/AcrR family transcriptional regulator n=1 Tax=Chitinolyticbacter meiyuanensis TaxID=682798 RepID=UPI0011E5DA1E|nr:TetR/AcrR family transcriptional regulator [Chitinolyticbacter meiyuanensis]